MTIYADSSALVKTILSEPGSDLAREYLASDDNRFTCWISVVEVRRVISRALTGLQLVRARAHAEDDFAYMSLVMPDEHVWRSASEVGEVLGVRSLDAVHLAAAQRLQIQGLTFLTFDLRQAQAARSLGFAVVGS
jgi:predicted nucleic acid-binding protein